MKKFFLTITVILSLLFSLISCGGLSSEYNYNCLEKDEFQINIFASFENDTVDSRSIVPESNLTVYSNYIYYFARRNIFTDDVPEVSESPVNLYTNFPDNKTGTIDIDLTPGRYEFNLFALHNALAAGFTYGDLVQNAVLVGTTTVDLTSYKTPDIKFNLIPNTSLSSCSVALNLYTTPDWTYDYTKYSITAALYNDNGDVYGTNGVTNVDNLPTNSLPPYAQYRTTVPTGIRPGMYDFEVVFTKRNDPVKKYVFSTTICVLPNTNTEIGVAIPNVIEYEPDAPTNLTASYKDPANNSQGYYIVNFKWDDNSINEHYFKLEVYNLEDYSDASKLTGTSTPWSQEYFLALSSSAVTIYDKNVTSTGAYSEGSLMANSTSLDLKLQLGKLYLARICAVNDAGESEYSYLDLTNGGTGKTGYSDFATDAKGISRYKITYNLAGGTVYYPDTTGFTDPIVEYHSYDSATILTIPNAQYTAIIKEGKNLIGWKKDSVSGIDFTDTTYTGFTNLNLFAKYE